MSKTIFNEWKENVKGVNQGALDALVIGQDDLPSLYTLARDESFLNQMKVFDINLSLSFMLMVIEVAWAAGDVVETVEFSLKRVAIIDYACDLSPLDAIRAGDMQRALSLADQYEVSEGTSRLLLCAWHLVLHGDTEGVNTVLNHLLEGSFTPVDCTVKVFTDIYKVMDVNPNHFELFIGEELWDLADELIKQGEVEKALHVIRGAESKDKFPWRHMGSVCKTLTAHADKKVTLIVVERALALLNKTSDGEKKSYLAEYAIILIPLDVNRALEVFSDALALPNNWMVGYKMKEIFSSFINHQLLAQLEELVSLMTSSMTRDAYSIFSELLSHNQIDLALKAANYVCDERKREVVEQLCCKDLDKAYVVAKSIEVDFYRYEALSYIAAGLFATDKDQAYALFDEIEAYARGLDDKEDKQSILVYLVSCFAVCDLNKVLPIKNEIAMGDLTGAVLSLIPDDVNQALDVAEELYKDIYLDVILPHVLDAVSLSQWDVETGLFKKLYNLKSERGYWKGAVLSAIAVRLIRNDFEKAWSFIALMSNGGNSEEDAVYQVVYDVAAVNLQKSWELYETFNIHYGDLKRPTIDDSKQSVEQLLELAYAQDSGWSRSDLLTEIALKMESSQQSLSTYEEAFSIRPKLEGLWRKSKKAVEVVQALTAHDISRAEDWATSIDYGCYEREHAISVVIDDLLASCEQTDISAGIPPELEKSEELSKDVNKAETLAAVGLVMARFDYGRAFRIVAKITKNSKLPVLFKAVFSIIGAYALTDLDDALLKAGKYYEDDFDSSDSYLEDKDGNGYKPYDEARKHEFKRDFYYWGSPQGFIEIVKALLPVDIKKAKAVALAIDSRLGRSEALFCMVEFLLHSNRDEAKKTVHMIEDEEVKKRALVLITTNKVITKTTETQPKQSERQLVAKINKLVKKINGRNYEVGDIFALGRRLRELIPINLEKAGSVHQKLNCDYNRAYAAEILALALIDLDLDRALAMAESMQSDLKFDDKAMVLLHVAKAFLPIDLKKSICLYDQVMKSLPAISGIDFVEVAKLIEPVEVFDKSKAKELYAGLLYAMQAEGSSDSLKLDIGGLLNRSVEPINLFDMYSSSDEPVCHLATSLMKHYPNHTVAISDLIRGIVLPEKVEPKT